MTKIAVKMSEVSWVKPWSWRALRPANDDDRGSRIPVAATPLGEKPLLRSRLRWWWRRERWGQADDPRTREVFAVLQIQTRLTTLAAILRRIESDAQMFARQHHWRTTIWAYDELLADACALARVPVREVPAGPKADAERLRRELALYECGWRW